MAILVKGGTLVTEAGETRADLLIEGERIAQVAEHIDAPGAAVVDAGGMLVLPGGVDVHVHLDLPMFGTVSSDDHYTGAKAAAFGGTTTVIDFVPQDSPSLFENIARWHEKADPKAAVDFSFHMNITRWGENTAAEIAQLPDHGITSVKVFTAYNGRLRLADGDIFQVLRVARDAGILTMLHAENGDVIDILVAEALASGRTEPIWHAATRPAWGAVEAALRGGALAAQAQAPLYLVHMNASGEADMLRYARQHGVPMFGETCPQYLFFTEDDLRRPDGAKWICSPPMRTAADNRRLWQALAADEIQVVATDHCPFFFDGSKQINYEGVEVAIPGKELGRGNFTAIPNGLPGLGDRLPILWTYGVGAGRISASQFVALNCANPARLFGMYPRKGALLPGSDADVVLWNPNQRVTYGAAVAQHRTDYNLYEGWALTGYPRQVFLRGQLIVDGGRWLGAPGMGRFIARKRFEAPL